MRTASFVKLILKTSRKSTSQIASGVQLGPLLPPRSGTVIKQVEDGEMAHPMSEPWGYVEFSKEELNLLRQWYNAVQDVNPKYLEAADHQLAHKILVELGMSPRSE